jgi:hypothetical protein
MKRHQRRNKDIHVVNAPVVNCLFLSCSFLFSSYLSW